MKHEVTIKYKDLSDSYLEMLIEILIEAGLDEKADEIKDFMEESSDTEINDWED